jgi:hypothetical protein
MPLFRSRSGDEKITRKVLTAILKQFPPKAADKARPQ